MLKEPVQLRKFVKFGNFVCCCYRAMANITSQCLELQSLDKL